LAINVDSSLDSFYNYSVVIFIVVVHLPTVHGTDPGSIFVTVALGVDDPLTSSIV